MSTESAPPAGKKPIILIVVIANLVLGGGAVGFIFLRGGDSAAAEAEHAPAGAPGGTAKLAGPILEFLPMVVNLNEPEGARYLKIGLAVQLTSEAHLDAAEKAKPVVRDHFLRELSELNFRQTMGNKNKLAIKRRLLKRFNEAVGADVALEIHITEFIVQ